MRLKLISISQLTFIAFTVLSLSIGQVLFKVASAKLELSSAGFLQSLINPTLVTALLVYLFATIMWLLVLKQTQLRIAYPFAALAFVFVPFLAHYLLHEPLHWNTMVGAFIICLGVWISSLD